MKTKEEKYLEKQALCGFNVGDKVEVLRKAKSRERGWPNSWVEEMNCRVGRTGRISGISRSGITLNFPRSSFDLDYPFYVLKKVQKARGTK